MKEAWVVFSYYADGSGAPELICGAFKEPTADMIAEWITSCGPSRTVVVERVVIVEDVEDWK